MADEPVKRASGLAPIIGALTAGKRPMDVIVKAGFAGAMCIYVFHEWSLDRKADREQRQQQHIESLALQREYRQEDRADRLRTDCIIERMTMTVRAATFRERPQPLEACGERKP